MVTVDPDKIGTVLRADRQHLGVVRPDKVQAAFVLFADNDLFGVFQHYAQQGADAGGACADDQNRVLRGDLGDPGGPEAGGQHVPHQQSLPVGDTVGDPVQTLVGKGHPHIFCLTTVDPAAQSPAAVGIGAVVDKPLLAEKAFPAEGFHIHRHPVSRLDMGHALAHGFHDAHHLMSHGDSGNGPGHAAVLDMQVAGADAGQSDLDNGIPVIQQHRLRLFRQCEISFGNVCICQHDFCSFPVKCFAGLALMIARATDSAHNTISHLICGYEFPVSSADKPSGH